MSQDTQDFSAGNNNMLQFYPLPESDTEAEEIAIIYFGEFNEGFERMIYPFPCNLDT